MYDVPYFKSNNWQNVLDFMQQNPFAIICGVNDDGFPIATHIPLLIEEKNNKLFLMGHFMRKQLHTIAFEKNNNVLVVFNGPSSYISATLYNPQNVASTYNYLAVHATGIVSFVEQEKLIEILDKLTDGFEKNDNSAASLHKMDKNYIAQHTKAIVGFEIEVLNLQHIFKTSQNKDDETKKKVQQYLQNGNQQQQALAAAMQHHM